MKRRHIVALASVGLFVLMVYFGSVFTELIGNSLAVLAFVGLAVWAVMTLRDPQRTRYETIGAWFTIPGMVLAIILGLFVLEDDSGPLFWLFFFVTIVSVYWALTSALWTHWDNQKDAASAS